MITEIFPDESGFKTIDKVSTRGDHVKPNPYKLEIFVRKQFYGVLTGPLSYYSSGYGVGLDMSWSMLPPRDSNPQEEAYRRAHAKLINVLKNRPPYEGVGFDVWINVFESRELKRLLEQIREYIKIIRNNKKWLRSIKRKGGVLVTASEVYLIWTFGIKPLIDAINQLLTTLNKGNINTEKIKVTGGFHEVDFYEGSFISDDPLYQARETYLSDTRIVIGFDASLVDLENAIMGQLGLLSPGSQFYQALPLSFVFDWFINVGSYLDTIEYLYHMSSYSLTNGYLTESVRTVRLLEGNGSKPGPWTLNGSGSDKYIRHNRSLITLEGLPVPFPRFKPRLNGGKLLSLGALLTQLLHRR